MPNSKLYIDVDDGAFQGTVKEVQAYLGFGSVSGISDAANLERVFEGHKLKTIGIISQKMMYGVFSEGEMVDSGTADELSKKYSISYYSFGNYCRTGIRLHGKYRIEMLGMTEKMEEL